MIINSNMTQSKLETIQEYVNRIMKEKELTTYEVERNSGGLIKQSYCSKVMNGYLKNLPVDKLKGLALGLKVTEEEIFAVARGVNPDSKKVIEEKFENLSLKFSGVPPSKKERADALLELMDREIDQLYR